ncbi:MAG TPA: transposase, partial [Methanomicrobia archaeon]|nr:transposase [Methanomicrobia archaeon]
MSLAKKLVNSGMPVSSTCKLLSIPRSSFYFYLKPINRKNSILNSKLAHLIQNFAYSFPSFGYRRITAILKQMGYHVNHKRIYRIYKQLNLQKSTSKGYKKKLLRIPFKPINPSKTNELWSLDVIEDTL